MVQITGRTDMNRVLIYYRHSFARRTVKEIPKVTSDTSFDQETIRGGGKQCYTTCNRYLENSCA